MVWKIITDIREASQKGLLTDGRYFIDITTATPLFLPLWYGNKLDLDKMVVYSGVDIKHPKLPDYNDLLRTGRLAELHVCRSYDIEPPMQYRILSNKRCDDIIKEFREHGFKVTREALCHNYNCWLADLKSGFRDEKNGYHLFTPCGCNPLSFRATSLDDRLDWQTTYEF